MNKPLTMQRLIKQFADSNDKNDKRTIILNISDYSNPGVQEYCKHQMSLNLLKKDLDEYNNNKQLEEIDIGNELTHMVINDYFLKDSIKAIVLSPEQYQNKFEEKSNLSFLMEKLFSITRGVSVKSLEESNQISKTYDQLKQSGLNNKIPVQFGLLQQVFFFDFTQGDQIKVTSQKLTKNLVQMVKDIQKLYMVPILDVKIDLSFGDTTQIPIQHLPQWKKSVIPYFLQESKNLLQNIVYELQQSEVPLEELIICTNFAECIASIKEIAVPYLAKLNTYQLKNEVESIAFQTLKICNQTIPPAVAGVFQKVSFSGALQRFDFALMEKIEQDFSSMNSWGQGVVVDYGFLNEAVMAFSLLLRHTPAHIYINNSLETLVKAVLGNFEDKQEPQRIAS